jgi:hypothetical protein
MRFNKHLRFRGEHAFLSPSNYHWINYSPNRLTERWTAAQASAWGSINTSTQWKRSELDGFLIIQEFWVFT